MTAPTTTSTAPPSTFEEVFAQRWTRMVKLAALTTGSVALGEEIVQDAFEQLHKNWATVQQPTAWLRAAVVNRCRDWLRRRTLERRHAIVTDDLVEPDEGIAMRDALKSGPRASAPRSCCASTKSSANEKSPTSSGAAPEQSVGAAAAGIFSAGTTEFVESVCGLNIDDARLVASDTDSLGNLVEFSVINGPTGDATIVGVKDPQGTWTYDEAGCGPWPGGAGNPAGRPWAGSPNLTLDGQATLTRVYGWIPQPATTAVVTFADGTTTRIDAGPEGYFLRLITTAPNANAAITHIEARTANDTLVAEGNPLG